MTVAATHRRLRCPGCTNWRCPPGNVSRCWPLELQSDAPGACGAALACMGLSTPALLLLPAATNLLASGGCDPQTALGLWQGAACTTIFVFAGTPVVLAPAVGTLFGPRDATAIYQKLAATILVASPCGSALLAYARDHSYLQYARQISETIGEDQFLAAFGAGRAELPALVKANTVTLPLLLRMAPPGTPDPTPLLYNDAFAALAGCSTVAAGCFIAAFRLARPR